MSFLSYNETYFLGKLKDYESRPLSPDDLYEAKQVLKILDDLVDEGYTALYDHLEQQFRCPTRLRTLITSNGEQPFAVQKRLDPSCTYNSREHEIHEAAGELLVSSASVDGSAQNEFLQDIRRFCEWIGYDDAGETAYVFLLRDALLPYLYFRSRNRSSCYPWLLSRKFFSHITSRETIDDAIRLAIYNALESGISDYDGFRNFCKKQMCTVLDEHTDLKGVLDGLLRSIPHKKILVIESGYCGTIPMLLASMDERVDFRMFTTAPFLYEIYGDRLFCRAYEKIRLFETLYSQDLYMQFADFRGGRFYVRTAAEQEIATRALAEVKAVLYGQK